MRRDPKKEPGPDPFLKRTGPGECPTSSPYPFSAPIPIPYWLLRTPQEGVTNYLKGNDPSKRRTGITGYSALSYSGLWDGIDLRLYDDQGQIRYDFEIASGIDPRQIAISFEGHEDLSIDEKGDLVVSVGKAKLIHSRPVAYQWKDEKRSGS